MQTAEDQDPQRLDIYWVNQFAAPPDQPGGSRHFEFARELGRRGHRVRILASDLSYKTGRYSRRAGPRDLRMIDERVGGVPFTWLTVGTGRADGWRRGIGMVIFGLNVLVALLRAPRSRGSTVFVGSSPQLLAALATWAAARVRRVPFVFEVRDLWPESYVAVSGRTRGPEVWMMGRIADLLYRRSDALIVLAVANADHVVERGAPADAVVHVPNGVDIEGFLDGEPAVDLREEGVVTFVYAGAHGPANDLATVVRACALLERRGRSDIRVVLIGDGVAKESLVRLAASLALDNLRFLDPIPRSAVGPTIATADAGLMVLAPVELFASGVSPNKLFDYLAAGLPVLTNVAGFVSEVVAEAGVGISVAGGDPAALADGMETLADDRPADAATRGPAFVRERYDRRVLVDRVESLLTGLASPA
ncbi:MAG: glycosyltransferase family 4 protein [Acidimicrobiales bacterium]